MQFEWEEIKGVMQRVSVPLLITGLLLACTPSKDSLDSLGEQSLFKGLSGTEYGKQAQRGLPIILPNDHASHPEYAIEWWYLTAILHDADGQYYPIQWTLFRFADNSPVSPWSDNQMFMAHAKVIGGQKQWFTEKFARGGVGNVGIESAPFSAFIDSWQWQSKTEALLPATLRFEIDKSIQATLRMQADDRYILHGDHGYSVKAADDSHASFYYSQPFISLSGQLVIDGDKIEVEGQGWFDHEWSSQLTDQDTLGWDWFSIHLDSGEKLMLARMRHKHKADFWRGTFIQPRSGQLTLTDEMFRAEVLELTTTKHGKLPLNWRIVIPEKSLDVTISPFTAEQWSEGTVRYYEGAVHVNGTHKGTGFIELTGY